MITLFILNPSLRAFDGPEDCRCRKWVSRGCRIQEPSSALLQSMATLACVVLVEDASAQRDGSSVHQGLTARTLIALGVEVWNHDTLLPCNARGVDAYESLGLWING